MQVERDEAFNLHPSFPRSARGRKLHLEFCDVHLIVFPPHPVADALIALFRWMVLPAPLWTTDRSAGHHHRAAVATVRLIPSTARGARDKTDAPQADHTPQKYMTAPPASTPAAPKDLVKSPRRLTDKRKAQSTVSNHRAPIATVDTVSI